jgi:hypothetical protein
MINFNSFLSTEDWDCQDMKSTIIVIKSRSFLIPSSFHNSWSIIQSEIEELFDPHFKVPETWMRFMKSRMLFLSHSSLSPPPPTPDGACPSPFTSSSVHCPG